MFLEGFQSKFFLPNIVVKFRVCLIQVKYYDLNTLLMMTIINNIQALQRAIPSKIMSVV